MTSTTSSKGKGAVLVGEDDRAAIEETLHIMSVPGMAEKVLAAHDEKLEDCVSADSLDW